MPLSCPDSSVLQAFALGDLPEGDWEAVAGHLEHCAGCSNQLQQFDHSADELVTQLKHLPPTDPNAPDAGDGAQFEALAQGATGRYWPFDAGRDLANRLQKGPVL